MPRLRLVGDTERNPDVIPFPMDRVRRVSRRGEDSGTRTRAASGGSARTDAVRQVEEAMTEVQKNLDELADLLAPLPFDRFARLRGDDDDDRPRAA